jgi:hypothetical protein
MKTIASAVMNWVVNESYVIPLRLQWQIGFCVSEAMRIQLHPPSASTIARTSMPGPSENFLPEAPWSCLRSSQRVEQLQHRIMATGP